MKTKSKTKAKLMAGATAVLVAMSGAATAMLSPADTQLFATNVWRAPLQCFSISPPDDDASLTDLSSLNDTAVVVLYGSDRRLLVYNRWMQPRSEVRFDASGPRGVRSPVSAAVTDSLIYIADDGLRVIKRFDFKGRDQGLTQLPFIPRRVRAAGSSVFVTPLIAGNTPSNLLFSLEGSRVRPLGAPIARYEDVGINTFANMTTLNAFPNRVVVMHEFVVPFGYVFRADRSEHSSRFAVPLPAELASRIERLPTPPITEKNVNDFTVVAFASAGAQHSGRTFYVTRIGDGNRRPYRKLLVELDDQQQLVAVYPISAHPHHMAYVSNPSAVITVDAEGNWTECRLP